MGRNSLNSCSYFSHDADMRNHRKVKAIRNKFTNGYAIWSMFLEYLTGADGNVFEFSDIETELLSGDFGFSVTEIREVLNYCISLEMLFLKEGFIYSESLNERLAPVYQKRGRSKEASAKQRRLNGKFATETTDINSISATEKPQSKVKESKVKESKVEERESPPTLKNIFSFFETHPKMAAFSAEQRKLSSERFFHKKGKDNENWITEAEIWIMGEKNKPEQINNLPTKSYKDL